MADQATILIVDDIEDNRLAVKAALRKEGYHFLEASDGQQGIEIARQHRPDLIIIDALMPNVNGFEAVRQLRSDIQTQRTPVLMISALDQKDDKIKAIEAGVDDFVSKPFDRVELRVRCQAFVRNSLLNRQYVLATRNPLTGLANKVALIQDLGEFSHPALFLFAIDNYDEFHEIHTMATVDAIERQFALNLDQLVPQCCPIPWQIYHFGDGEFAILLDDAVQCLDVTKAHEFSSKLADNIQQGSISIDESDFDISITLGFSMTRENILENARLALRYAQKQNQPSVFAEDIIEDVQDAVQKNFNWLRRVKEAIQDDRIIAYFQPIYNNLTSTIERYEALVRLVDIDGTVHSPFHFLPAAKSSRYYFFITQSVIEQSFAVFESNQYEFSVNLTRDDIEQDFIRGFLLKKIMENPETAKRLTFEFVEDESLSNYDVLKKFVKQVKSYGVKIAIDDFGAGYSNFVRLLDLQADVLKIDGSLVRDMDHNHVKRNIVETIKVFADKANMTTVAEFVSNEKIFSIVKDIGIQYSQGYYIAAPEAGLATRPEHENEEE